MLRLGEQAHRIAAYYRALQAYFQEHSAEGGDFVALNNYSDGRPALRAAGETVAGQGGARLAELHQADRQGHRLHTRRRGRP